MTAAAVPRAPPRAIAALVSAPAQLSNSVALVPCASHGTPVAFAAAFVAAAIAVSATVVFVTAAATSSRDAHTGMLASFSF